jgi:hypothetical protein
MAYLHSLQSIETATGRPVSFKDPEFKALKTMWIYNPGLHIGIDRYDGSIVFACRIT